MTGKTAVLDLMQP